MIIKDQIDLAEEDFFDPDLLSTEYFLKYREGYWKARRSGLLNNSRNYIAYINYLAKIFTYNREHARSFCRRIKSESKNWKNCEAVVSEMIVYESYIRLVDERLIKGIHLESKTADVIIERIDGSRYYLEVFCIMPNFESADDGEIKVQSVKTHTQDSFASVRKKLLRKIELQKQFQPGRENYAVIELNHPSIAMDFTVLSSLSDGYKIHFNRETREPESEGYDWSSSVFHLPATRGLSGVIWFHLGDYHGRKTLLNPNHLKC